MDDDLGIYKQLTVDSNDSSIDVRELKAIIEGLLFTAGEPLSIEEISDVLEISKKDVRKLVSEMIDAFNFERRGVQIISFNQKYQLGTRPEHAAFIRKLLKSQSKQSLSKAAVETAAIIAYKQPITRQGVDTIRGVKCDRIIVNLVEKKLIREVGRLDAPGRPILYGTTDEFLKYFGLKGLDELPKLESFNLEA